MRHTDPKIVLLYRFHLVVILINVLAFIIDTFSKRYLNSMIELCVIIVLAINLIYLYRQKNLRWASFSFIIAMSLALFLLIYLNHFATMSVVFVLLLPLTTLVFLELKESMFMTVVLFVLMAIILYLEKVYNPQNLLAQNFTAMYNLAYTAVIIYVFGLLYHFSILRTFSDLDTSNHQKALLLKEVHHRVKNNLNVIASIIGLQETTLEGKAKIELNKSKSRIESIALVHEMLYKHENFDSINFEVYIERLSKLLLEMYASDTNISMHIKSDIQTMPLEIMVQLGIMIHELLTNSIKYAFSEDNGNIYIRLEALKKTYTLIYEDDGVGHPNPKEISDKSSLGLKLIFLTVKQLKGSLEISSEKGLKYMIRFTA